VKTETIKRSKALLPFSRDHHYGLLLCWKIREGFKRNIAPKRIKSYVDWFWETYLEKHFEEEEKSLFPILGNENERIKKAVRQHRRLKRLFKETAEIQKSISLIEEELESHIRFEERILFNEIQNIVTFKQLETLYISHSQESFCDNQSDPFWE
jgi:iron-sulfur cluster repair protein YtfE (RIC family)